MKTHESRIKEIIAYAELRGLSNVRVEEDPGFGYYLYGTGEDLYGWPRVWAICHELGMLVGCGSEEWHQCDLENATIPSTKGQ